MLYLYHIYIHAYTQAHIYRHMYHILNVDAARNTATLIISNCKGENRRLQWRNLIITIIDSEASSHFVTPHMMQHEVLGVSNNYFVKLW